MAYLELTDITKRFRGVTAVDNLSLSVEQGEILCLLGPSGCGKTTTLRIIAGFEDVETGTIELGGKNLTNIPPERRDIGLVFQNYALFPHLTVNENVAFGLQMRKLPGDRVRAAVSEALSLVRLEHLGGRYPRQLSGGQQQRIALARAIAIKPRLLLLDEPLSNLDAKLRDVMRDEIRRVQREVGITTVFVTHDQVEALALADRMAVMENGRVVQVDTPVRVYERPADPFIAGFIGYANLIPGRVVQIGDGLATLDAGGSLLLKGICEGPVSSGHEAVAVVKTERVRLLRSPAASGVNIRVQIHTRTFLGPTIVYGFSAGETRLAAVVPNQGGESLAIGDEVFASWDPADCLIVPGRPGLGLDTPPTGSTPNH